MNNLSEIGIYIFEYCIIAGLCKGIFGLKNEKLELLKSFLFCLGLVTVGFIFRLIDFLGNLLPVAMLLIIFSYSVLFLKGKIGEKALTLIISAAAALAVNLLVKNVFGAVFGDGSALSSSGMTDFAVWVTSNLIFLIACVIVVRKIKKKAHSLTGLQLTILFSCLLITFFIATIFGIVAARQPETMPVFFIVFALVGILNILLYLLMRKMHRDNVTKEEYDLLRSSISAQEKLALESRERYSEIRALRHDMKHYLTTAAGLISDGKPEEAKAYLEQIAEEKINPSSVGVNTGSAVIDAAINSKIALCAERGIKTKCVIDTRFEGASDIDLSILLSNLMENAIEGCDAPEPLIELDIGRRKSLTYIIVKNGISASVLENNPNLETSKSDKSTHGFGVRSIRSIAEKYDGSVTFREENGKFIAEIWLKIGE